MKALELFENITEYSDRQLKAISLLRTDTIMSDLLDEYVDNKKHVKRKYSSEIREIIKDITGLINEERRSKWKFWKGKANK